MSVENVVFEDVFGVAERRSAGRISSANLDGRLVHGLIEKFGGDVDLTPIQSEAIAQGITWERSHFIVAAPTNSGKTLVALLRIFEGCLRRAERFVYVVPLKALAEEKLLELEAIARAIKSNGGPAISVGISTGDYRVSEDFPDSPPVLSEILVCTPERLDVLLRNPENSGWSRSVHSFVLDEFHLVGDELRGARFESLVTRILTTCCDSSIIALSATFGSVKMVTEWFAQSGCRVKFLSNNYRFPRLVRRFVEVEDKNQWIRDYLLKVLPDSDRSVLVFVYRQSDVLRLAKYLQESSANVVGAFYSALPIREKSRLVDDFSSGKLRVLVCTTALAMGINSPASDVIVRDTVFHGFGTLTYSDLSQMIGRAGRGQREGVAHVLFSNVEQSQSLSARFKEDLPDDLVPRLIPHKKFSRKAKNSSEGINHELDNALLAQIASRISINSNELIEFISHTFSATCHAIPTAEVTDSLQRLEKEKLIYLNENSESLYSATKLGRTTSFAGLSAASGAMFGSFLRAMISLSEKTREAAPNSPSFVARLTKFDLLVICVASIECQSMWIRTSTGFNRDRVMSYLEGLPSDEKPLCNLWRDADSDTYPTRRLLATLRLDCSPDAFSFEKIFATAALIHEYSEGKKPLQQLIDEWSFKGDFEGRLISTTMWLLNALASICNGDRCYRLDFLRPKLFELTQELAVGGGLGGLLAVKGIGLRTVERIRGLGVRQLDDLRKLGVESLAGIGINKTQTSALKQLLVRRSR